MSNSIQAFFHVLSISWHKKAVGYVIGFVALASIAAAETQFTVERGDVISVEILQASELSREAKINVDGMVVLPVLGGLKVAGLSLELIREKISNALSDLGLIHEPTVLVEMAAYRPVYVGGAVARPGAIAFSPGLTVRQALVTVGDVRSSTEDEKMPPEMLVQLLAESRATKFELAQIEAQIVRLETELGQRSETDISGTGVLAENSDIAAASALDFELALFKDRKSREDASAVHIKALLNMLDFELEVLQEQSKLQREEAAIQTDEITNARSLLDRGLIPRPQLQQMMREKSQLSRDVLANQAAMARARQAKETTSFELTDLETRTRIELRKELRDALNARVRTQAILQTQEARLVASGIQVSEGEQTQRADTVVTIHRTKAGQVTEIEAELDTYVAPGDVVQISLELPNGRG